MGGAKGATAVDPSDRRARYIRGERGSPVDR